MSELTDSVCITFQSDLLSDSLGETFRRLGYRSTICYLPRLFEVLNELRSELTTLNQQLPRLLDYIHSFENVECTFLDKLDSITIENLEEKRNLPPLQKATNYNSKWSADFLTTALSQKPGSDSNYHKAFLTIYWVVGSWLLWKDQTDLIDENQSLQWLLDLQDLLSIQPELQNRLQLGLSIGINEWALELEEATKQLREQLQSAQKGQITILLQKVSRLKEALKGLSQPIIAVPNLPQDLENYIKDPEDNNTKKADENEKKYYEKWGNRGCNELEERELLPEHWTVATNDELKRIKNLLFEKNDSSKFDLREVEKFICRVAICTGRTPTQTLSLNLYVKPNRGKLQKRGINTFGISYPHEALILERVDQNGVTNPKAGNSSWRITWYRPIEKSTKSNREKSFFVDLPKSLVDIIIPYFLCEHTASFQIKDLLPATEVIWPERLKNWLDKHLHITEGRIRVIIRRMIGLKSYEDSSSKALMSFLYSATSSDKNDDDSSSRSLNSLDDSKKETFSNPRESTSIQYYISTNSERAKDIVNKSIISISSNEEYVKERQQESAVRIDLLKNPLLDKPLIELRASYVDALSSGNRLNIHNAYSCYVLGCLIVATGHRVSRTPFHFPWDQLLPENLAFICDKRIVGSEARFVPLTDVVVTLLKEYRLYLIASFEEYSSAKNPIAIHFKQALIGPINNSAESNKKYFGVFFHIKENIGASGISKLHCLAISTARVATQAITSANESPIKSTDIVRSWRAQISNFLWEKGLSEAQIRAFLGHNDQNHLFGMSSTWTIDSWSERVRPILDQYLIEQEFEVLKSPFHIDHDIDASPIPSLTLSKYGYEGRLLDKLVTKSRFITFLSKQVADHWVDDESGIEFNVKDKNIILSQADETPFESMDAKKAFMQEVSSYLEGGRKTTTINPQKYHVFINKSAGPVSTAFSRYYCIAKNIRNQWEHWMTVLWPDSLDFEHRVTRMAVSLILCDAIYNPEIVRRLILSLWSRDTLLTSDGMVVRSEILLPSIRYEACVLLSKETTAIALGLRSDISSKLNELNIDSILRQGFDRCLGGLVDPKIKDNWTLEFFCLVFQSWWYLRLPGFIHAGASGTRPSPAPSANSLNSFLGIPTEVQLRTREILTPFEVMTIQSFTLQKQQNSAQSAINLLFNEAAGEGQPANKASSTSKRERLIEALDNPLPAILLYWSEEREVVDILLQFIRYLLVVGGVKKNKLRFGPIRTYFSTLSKRLIVLCWEDGVTSLKIRDLDTVFDGVINSRAGKTSDGAYVVDLFKQFLHRQYDIDVSRKRYSSYRTRINIRGDLVGPEMVYATTDRLKNKYQAEQEVDLLEAAVTHLAVAYGYGLRSDENYSLHAKNFHVAGEAQLRVRNNRAGLVKSMAGKRIFPGFYFDKRYRRVVINLVERIRLRERAGWLYGQTFNFTKRYSSMQIKTRTIQLLREVANNRSLVEHNLRHSFCNRLELSVLPAGVSVPLTTIIRNALLNAADKPWIDHLHNSKLPPDKWPFWIDRIEALMGHEDIYTAYWYWKCDFIFQAEYAKQSNDQFQIKWSEVQLARILNISASAVSQRYSSIKERQGVTYANWVNYIDDILRVDGYSLSQINHVKEHVPIKENEISAPFATALFYSNLLGRMERNINLNLLLSNFKEGMGSTKIQYEQAIDNYAKIVTQTCFDDFEPNDSELSIVEGRKQSNVLSFRSERFALINKACSILSQRQVPAVVTAIYAWESQLDSEKPYWIISDLQQAKACILFLIQMGFSESAIGLYASNFDYTEICNFDLGIPKDQIILSESRLSLGPTRAKVSELGISLLENKETQRQYNRELHRILIILRSCLFLFD